MLSDGASTSVQGDQRRLAGLNKSSTSRWVSDLLMMEACTVPTPAMADTLRQLHVQAPPEYQQSITGLAAITHYAQYGNSQSLRAVSTQLDPQGPGSADAKIVQTLCSTLPEFKLFQQQIERAAGRAAEADLGAVKDPEWSRRKQNSSPTAAADGAAPSSPGTALHRQEQPPQTPRRCPATSRDHPRQVLPARV